MSRRSNKTIADSQPETQPETEAQEREVPVLGQAGPDENVKEVSNDQTSAPEPGEQNAPIEQIEARKDVVLSQEPPSADANQDPETANDHMLIGPDDVRPADAVAAEAQRLQSQNEALVRDAFVSETRAETLDSHTPRRVEDVRILVETNNHLDRSGNDVTETDANRIVISDGVDEARMIDVQPEGTVSEKIDLGNGIVQTNLK